MLIFVFSFSFKVNNDLQLYPKMKIFSSQILCISQQIIHSQFLNYLKKLAFLKYFIVQLKSLKTFMYKITCLSLNFLIWCGPIQVIIGGSSI